MRRLREGWSRFVAWTSRREPATALAVFRVAVGLVVLLDLVDTVTSGAYPLLWRGPADGGVRTLGGDAPVFWLLGDPTPALVDGVYAATVIASALLVLGVGARPAALVALQGAYALYGLHPGSGGGHDRLITNALWLLVFARSDATLSITSRWRTGSWVSDEAVPAWPRYLVVHQAAVMYVSAGVVKLGAEWWPQGDFRAVYQAVLDPTYARADWSIWAARLFPLTQIATFATVLFECSWFVVPLLMVLGRARVGRFDVRLAYLAVGVVLHGLLAITLNLGPFSAITLAFYACVFGPDDYARLAAWIRSRTRPGTAGRPAPLPQP